MRESFLHFVWQHQYFNAKKLSLTNGTDVVVRNSGFSNPFAGPDFKEALVEIDDLRWYGAVEIHVKSSDWYKHKHESDVRYHNVILHVVYEYDSEVVNDEGKPIPTLELKGLIKPGLLRRYSELMDNTSQIPCESQLHKVKVVTRLAMLEMAVVDRLNQKCQRLQRLLEFNKGDWEETAYQWLCHAMGFKVNSEKMLELSQLIPLKLLRRESTLEGKEALLFGASGLLNVDFREEYPVKLKNEFDFLTKKHQLSKTLSYNDWHFKGVRPNNFPTKRIAQLASIIHHHEHILSLFTVFKQPKEIVAALDVGVSPFWEKHYSFTKASKTKFRGLSKLSIHNLQTNVVCLLMVTYSRNEGKPESLERALNILMSIPAEKNRIIDYWKGLGWHVSSAFDSQGLIQLFNNFCTSKKCLECKIGVELIAPKRKS